MSIEQLEAAARALGDLRERVVFVGGATVGLWRTDPAARRPRVTVDVDVLVEVASLGEYSWFQDQLRALGFVEDAASGVLCRWRGPDDLLVLDAIPTEGRLAGLPDARGWLRQVAQEDVRHRLPSGLEIRVAPAPWLLVLKLEAFADRGGDDVLASRDFEDVVLLVDGREELDGEIARLPDRARAFVTGEMARIVGLPAFDYGVEGSLLGPDARNRAMAVTLPRLRRLAGGT